MNVTDNLNRIYDVEKLDKENLPIKMPNLYFSPMITRAGIRGGQVGIIIQDSFLCQLGWRKNTIFPPFLL